MTRWIGRALIAASAAGMVYGVYLMAGKGWAVLVGSFAVYAAGYHMTTRKRADAAQERFDEAHTRVSVSIQEARQAARHRRMN